MFVAKILAVLLNLFLRSFSQLLDGQAQTIARPFTNFAIQQPVMQRPSGFVPAGQVGGRQISQIVEQPILGRYPWLRTLFIPLNTVLVASSRLGIPELQESRNPPRLPVLTQFPEVQAAVTRAGAFAEATHNFVNEQEEAVNQVSEQYLANYGYTPSQDDDFTERYEAFGSNLLKLLFFRLLGYILPST